MAGNVNRYDPEAFRDCVAIITGGASGIARSLAFALAREGAKLVIADIQLEPAEKVASELNAIGAESIAVRCDISEAADVEHLAGETLTRFGGINLLCNVAGVTVVDKLHETSRSDLEWLFHVNVYGMFNTVRRFVPELRASAKRGEVAHIINASSGFGVAMPSMGPTLPSAYAGTKHAIVGFSDAMRAELAEDGIGVSVFCPGLVNTQTWNSKNFRQERFGGPVPGTPDSRARVEAYGQNPDETAAMIISRVKRGDFYILPLDEMARATMERAINERYEELLKAVRAD
jgi:NAD(P)-dependent dehydrogenase (short-subunit alcohol dehydrogenase family)